MRLHIFFTVLLFFAALNAADAKSERTAQACQPRVPEITMDQAISIAGKANPMADKSFIDAVSLECQNGVASWKIGFRLEEYESGHFIVTVFMDGKTETSVVKDG